MKIKESIIKEFTELFEINNDIRIIDIFNIEIVGLLIVYDYTYVSKDIIKYDKKYKQHDMTISIEKYKELLLAERLKKIETI